MEAPKCRLCGKRHWDGCAPAITQAGRPLMRADGEPLTAGDLIKDGAYEVNPDTNTLTPLNAVARKHAARAPRGTFDRNAYQREYMRKRRAAQKAALD
jgi:hypothetical protein